MWTQSLSNILRNRLHFNFGGLIFKIAETALRPNHWFLFVLFGLFKVVLLSLLTSNRMCGLRDVGCVYFKWVIVADMLTFRAEGPGFLCAFFVSWYQFFNIWNAQACCLRDRVNKRYCIFSDFVETNSLVSAFVSPRYACCTSRELNVAFILSHYSQK